MADVTKRLRLSSQEWDELIQDYRSSGLPAAKWCETLGFKITQLRWQIPKKQNTSDQPIKWITLHTQSSVSDTPSITIKIGNAENLLI